MLGKEISEAHTKQLIFRWMLEVCVHLCVKQSMCTHVEIMQAKALSLSPFCSCFASVYGHNLLCVCVQSHAQWPHLLSLSSDVYLEQCSSEIKGQKRRVVCSFISAPSDGGWQFLQLTPPDAFTAVGMCAVYVYVCVCVFSLTLDLLLYLIFPTAIFFSQLTVSHPLAPLALQ